MPYLDVNSSKAQMKIQQMAFMLVAVMIFFSMVALIYFSISLANLQSKVKQLRDNEARETAKIASSIPELIYAAGTDCSACIDLDKALLLKEEVQSGHYRNMWNFDYLMIERINSKVSGTVECNKFNYPDNCNTITIIKKTDNFGVAKSAFVALVYFDQDVEPMRYEIGRVYASGVNLYD